MITERIYKIIGLLASNDGIPMPSIVIAERIGCSPRTIKRDIAKVCEGQYCKESGFNILATKDGYRLLVENKIHFRQFLETMEQTFSRWESKNEVVFSIIKLLLVSKNITQDELSEKLFFSRSTLNKHMSEVKEVLGGNGITLNAVPHYGYQPSGYELDIRNYMATIFFKSDTVYSAEKELLDVLKVNIPSVASHVVTLLGKHGYKLSDSSMNNLLRYILISAVRIQNSKEIEFEQNQGLKIDPKTSSVCSELADYLGEVFSISLSGQERCYLAYLIGNPYKGGKNRGNKTGVCQDMVEEMLQRIDKVYGVDFHDDARLRKGLLEHIYSTFHRYSLHVSVGNPLITLIKSQYIEAYNFSILCCGILEDSYHLSVTEDDIGYIALHFAAAMERNNKIGNYRVVLVCGGSIGTYQLVQAKLSKSLPGISIVDVCSTFEIEHYDLSSIDFIIHVIPLGQKHNIKLAGNCPKETPIVQVAEPLSDNAIASIQDCINHFKDFSYLRSLFRPDLFYCDVEVQTKEEALRWLTAAMLEKGYITPDTQAAILKREMISATEINDLVAIPHSILPIELQSVLAIGILKRPVSWGHSDVQLVFVGAINPAIQVSKKVFPLLYKLTVDKSKVKRLMTRTTFDSFVETLFGDLHIVV